MGFIKADLLRLPILVAFDGILSDRISIQSVGVWEPDGYTGYMINVTLGILCMCVFTCEPGIISKLYRLFAAVTLSLAAIGWNFSTISVIHRHYYGEQRNTLPAISVIMKNMWNNEMLVPSELDFTAKVALCFAALQVCYWLILVLLDEALSPLSVILYTSPAWSLMLTESTWILNFTILISELPVLILFAKKAGEIRPGLAHLFFLRRNGYEAVLDDFITAVQDTWVECRVPSVLRLFFMYRCILGLLTLYGQDRSFTTDEYDPSANSGLYYFFFSSDHPKPLQSQYWEDWDGIEGYFDSRKDSKNLTLLEGMCAMLTESLLSSFSVGAAMSVIGFYAGTVLHEFIGGNDLAQGEALGMMSSILFCLLAIQTRLSVLPPWKRIVRLYRNSFLLLSAILHFCLDIVHPVLMTISPQSHIPLRKHVNPLLICLLLLMLPSGMCYWLLTTKCLSTWMIALTAFNLELVVKVLSTLMVYALYVMDSRYHANGIINLDDYVFWIRSICHVIEFICGLVMFINGAYILMFESSNWLRAVMMTMHAYVNIYRTFREGIKTLNNRRFVNSKISSLAIVDANDIPEQDKDVCSICYQDFILENGEIRKTRCRHMFHTHCLRKWIFIQDTCPMCDRPLFSSETNKQD